MISFKCDSCSKTLKAPAEYAGHNIKCPACANLMSVPQPDTGDQPAEPASDVYNLLSGLDDGETIEQERPAPKVVNSEPDPAFSRKPEKKPAGDGIAASASRYFRSVVLCTIFAAAGAVVWAMIAKFTGYEIGWIAWGIGAVAGLGALMGGSEPSIKLGVTASVIAVCAILAGKLLVINWMYSEYNDNSYYQKLTDSQILESFQDEEEYATVVFMWHMIDSGIFDKLVAEQIDETAAQEQTSSLLETKEDEIQNWSDSKKVSAARTVYARLPELDDATAAIKEGFIASFGAMDTVFIGLAVVTAFKMAVGLRA